MLKVISQITDPFLDYIRDDPVRPEIPREFRVREPNRVFALVEEDQLTAMVCCAYCRSVPSSVEELFSQADQSAAVAVFYTIWSYRPGAGRRLITAARQWHVDFAESVREFITLSPPTDLAREFHLRNGARVYRVNSDTVNYQYL